jgi:hypothetical protein
MFGLATYFFFFVAAFFFAGAFFFVGIRFTSDPCSLYDYCSPLPGKLRVKNIFKSCHTKFQSKNHVKP